MSKIYELEEVLECPEEAERKGFSINDDVTQSENEAFGRKCGT